MKEIVFQIHHKTNFGENLFVLGNIYELGNWNIEKAIKMHWFEGNFWKISIFSDIEVFSYKYIIQNKKENLIKWEEGSNRNAEIPKNIERFELKNEWEKFEIQFSIFYVTNSEKEILCVIGGVTEIGNWKNSKEMKIGATKILLTGEKSNFVWEYNTFVPSTTNYFEYRYLVYNKEKNVSLWEREPNRIFNIGKNKAINGIAKCEDVNFVSGLVFHEIPPYNLFIGPYPQNKEHIDILYKAGITAIFNVQTDEDRVGRQINWKEQINYYKEKNIELIAHQICDFNEEDLCKNLKSAADEINDLINRKHKVYIHCTAGMGRAPACAAFYLICYKKMEIDESIQYLKKFRSVCVPNRNALKREYLKLFPIKKDK